LRGRADEFEAMAAATKPLLGNFVMQGQATMIYAEPNTGKTLIALKLCFDAIDAGLIDPNNLYYVNADDSSEGFATKLRLMDDVGAHTLVPGMGLKTSDLECLLVEAVEERWARGTCVVIDTLKKFTDLMHKSRSSEFAQICRRFVMGGGTIVALGHTAKNPNADGTPRYQGTTDILEDFDAVYVAQLLTSKAHADVRVAKFMRKKFRGPNPQTVAYAYAADAKVPYLEKLASVRRVDPDDLDDYTVDSDKVSDPPVMAALVRLIQEEGSELGQMALAKAVAKECRVSQRAALGVLDRYTGTEPNKHLWTYETGHRGRRVFRLIDQAKRPT
jgi:RecA-family ATPase